MKQTFDFSKLKGIFKDIPNGQEIEKKLFSKIESEQKHISPALREMFFNVPINGNDNNAFAFEFLDCYICLHCRRVYNKKTWKCIRNEYSVEAYKIIYAHRTNVYDELGNEVLSKTFTPCKTEIEDVDTDGNPC